MSDAFLIKRDFKFGLTEDKNFILFSIKSSKSFSFWSFTKSIFVIIHIIGIWTELFKENSFFVFSVGPFL